MFFYVPNLALMHNLNLYDTCYASSLIPRLYCTCTKPGNEASICSYAFCICVQTNDRRISVKLDISAPHIILPENFHDQETAMVSKQLVPSYYRLQYE